MAKSYYNLLASPLGQLTVCSDEESITELHISGDRFFSKAPQHWHYNPEEPLLLQAKQQLDAYFSGELQHFSLPLRVNGTPFQKLVWQGLQRIPFGSTVSYLELAQMIGKPSAVRAVANAVGKNPLAIILPCHRVIAHNGTIGGFGAGLPAKRLLLKNEGVLWSNEQILDQPNQRDQTKAAM